MTTREPRATRARPDFGSRIRAVPAEASADFFAPDVAEEDGGTLGFGSLVVEGGVAVVTPGRRVRETSRLADRTLNEIRRRTRRMIRRRPGTRRF